MEATAVRLLQNQAEEVQPRRFGDLITCNAALQAELDEALAVDVTGRTPLALIAETGTGKELLAHWIHNESGRDGPLVVVNCSTLGRSLAESRLFGAMRGAFTGAVKRMKGFFEQASGGTLFLDEISHLSLKVQAMLLRAVECGEVLPVGAERPVKVNVRIVCATSRNLGELVEEDQFLKDLRFRLAVNAIRVPALRERSEDIAHLAQHFARQGRQEQIQLSEAALELLLEHPWPGNVRELKTVVRRAARVASHRQALTIQPGHLRILDAGLQAEAPTSGGRLYQLRPDAPLHERKEAFEADAIISAARQLAPDRRTFTALYKALGISRSLLSKKLEKYGLPTRVQEFFAQVIDEE